MLAQNVGSDRQGDGGGWRHDSGFLGSGPRKATIDGWPLMTSAIESVMVGNHVL